MKTRSDEFAFLSTTPLWSVTGDRGCAVTSQAEDYRKKDEQSHMRVRQPRKTVAELTQDSTRYSAKTGKPRRIVLSPQCESESNIVEQYPALKVTKTAQAARKRFW